MYTFQLCKDDIKKLQSYCILLQGVNSQSHPNTRHSSLFFQNHSEILLLLNSLNRLLTCILAFYCNYCLPFFLSALYAAICAKCLFAFVVYLFICITCFFLCGTYLCLRSRVVCLFNRTVDKHNEAVLLRHQLLGI